MPPSGPRTVRLYSDEFKLTAVRLSHRPGIQVRTVAAALAIDPFMRFKWRKDARARAGCAAAPGGRHPQAAGPAREIAQLQALEAKYAALREEHELLKKAIRFCSARSATSSPSSRPSARTSGSPPSAGATR